MDELLIRNALTSQRIDIDCMISELSALEHFIDADLPSKIHMDAAISIRQTTDTLRAAILLSEEGHLSSALALCRTGLEQALGNMLNLREQNLLWFYTFSSMDDASLWVEQTRATLNNTSDLAFIGKPTECNQKRKHFCVPVVRRNLTPSSDGMPKTPFPGVRLLAVIERHRHEFSTSGEEFRGLLYPYIGDKQAIIDQKHHYKHHFTRRALVDAVRIHGLLSPPEIEKWDRHYNFLSLFSHGTADTDEYLELRGQPRSRAETVIRTLISLYVYCILEVELRSFQTFSDSSEGLRLKHLESLAISDLRGSNRRSWLGFVSADPHSFDIYREKSYRSDLNLLENLGKDDLEDGYMRADDREFFDTNFLTRLNEGLSPTRNILSGDFYNPPELM